MCGIFGEITICSGPERSKDFISMPLAASELSGVSGMIAIGGKIGNDGGKGVGVGVGDLEGFGGALGGLLPLEGFPNSVGLPGPGVITGGLPVFVDGGIGSITPPTLPPC